MPGDATVEEAKHERQNGGARRHDRHPRLTVEVAQVDKPIASSPRLGLRGAVVGEQGLARLVAALERRLNGVGHGERLGLDLREDQLLDQRPENHRERHREVMEGRANGVVAEEGRRLERAEEEDQRARAEPKDDAQEAGRQVAVVRVVLVLLVRRVVRIEEVNDADGGEGVPRGVHHEDADDQERKDLVREAGSKANIAGDVEEGRQEAVEAKPDAHPRVEGQVRDAHVLGHGVERGGHRQHGAGGSHDAQGHPTDEGIHHSHPAGRDDRLNRSNLVLGDLAVDRAESEGRRDDGDEDEQRHRHRLLVEVLHLLAPVRADRPLDVANDATAPRLRRVHDDLASAGDELGVRRHPSEGLELAVVGLVVGGHGVCWQRGGERLCQAMHLRNAQRNFA
mmetsp:Transcript_37690/g.86220  ORF Transcript_37690/g.86220 Transcript_37690/m.86220 type:complete len:396 (-) Transcript_37690:18-1205(-)